MSLEATAQEAAVVVQAAEAAQQANDLAAQQAAEEVNRLFPLSLGSEGTATRVGCCCTPAMLP